jgi:polygalacturonase
MTNMSNCRKIFCLSLSFLLFSICNCLAKDPWLQADEILQRIKPPVFPERNFTITDFGAVGNGKIDCTKAIKDAIEAASKAGGGRVVVPPGVFLSGPIHLKSNINLYLSEGSTIKFSNDPNLYLPAVITRWEGVECMNYSPLIYAYNQKNIAITGKGTLDGNGENWWPWRQTEQRKIDRTKLFKQGSENVPVKDRRFKNSRLNPNMIEPYRCKNILIEGIKIINAPSGIFTQSFLKISRSGTSKSMAKDRTTMVATRNAAKMS